MYANVFVWFYASDMQLEVDSDAAFLVLPNSKSRIARYFCLLHNQHSPNCRHVDNGPILVKVQTVRTVLTSAAEMETRGLFHNTKLVLSFVRMLKEMGHPQRNPARICTDNSTSSGFANNNIVLKHSKFWDLKLHWLRDKQTNTIFLFFGTKERTMMLITSPSIIPLFIIVILKKKEYTSGTFPKKLGHTQLRRCVDFRHS